MKNQIFITICARLAHGKEIFMFLSNKYMKRGISFATIFVMTCCMTVADIYAADESSKPDYDQYIFDSSIVHTINIEISEEDWSDLLANPTQKTKYEVAVEIDGEHYDNVSFATKGNTSLSNVAASDSDRYSFKLNFGYYDDDQTYHGAKKINLSNCYADATYMKDYISYEIFKATGVDAPLTSYVQLSINDQVYGLYLAIEEIGSSYLERTQEGSGELYKPSNGIDNMNEIPENFELPDDFEIPDGLELPEDTEEFDAGNFPAFPSNGEAADNAGTGNFPAFPSDGEAADGETPDFDFDGNFPDFDFSFGGGASSGEDLKYTDDELSSYSGIFDNAETESSEEDETRVVEALKNLSEGNVEAALDTDEVIRYFAAHNFVLNYDSYTGSMLHNYYLYENNGLLSMLPWDYNLAFGSFANMGIGNEEDATELINTGIDSPLSGSTEEDRPMWAWIINDENYTEQYHKVYDELLSSYIESGALQQEMERIYELIRPYVETDPTAFYTVDEFDTAYENLLNFCLLRAESIRKQLDGTLSTITNEQNTDERVDGSAVSISATGSMNMGKIPGDMDFDFENMDFNGMDFDNMDFSENPFGYSAGTSDGVPSNEAEAADEAEMVNKTESASEADTASKTEADSQ